MTDEGTDGDEETYDGDATAGVSGQRVVLALYLGLVGVAAGMGIVLSVILEPEAVALFGVIDLPSSAFGLALYGAITVGVLLGAPLLAVRYISNNDVNIG